MRIGNRNFSPKFWPSLAAILILPVLIALGFWQLDRADQKWSRYEILARRQTGETVDLNRDMGRRNNMEEMLWRNVSASGHFMDDVQILLDSQVLDSQAGYFVFTPFQLNAQDAWFLVNRGWVAAGDDRNQVPAFHRTGGTVSISGTAATVPASGIRLGEPVAEQLTPGVYRLQVMDIAHAGNLVGIRFMPYTIRLNPDSQYCYVCVQHSPESGAEVHLAYAFQWFLLAATLLIIYIMVNLEKIQDENKDE